MKKYLITGALALVVSTSLISCHSDDDFSGSIVEQKLKAYEQVFEEEFGKINPNQNWGFSSASSQSRTLQGAITRGDAEPRANMWADLGYDVPRELTPGQIERVVYYFQHNKFTPGGSKDWTDFFVQQVYKGGTSPIGDGTNGYSTERYQCANGDWITGGDQMDYLTANNGDHVGNFNYGRYGAEDPSDPNGLAHNNVQDSPGVDYLTAGQGQEPNHHKDHINLMLGSKAENFGYGNSNANKTYYDKYVLIDGSVIDKWMSVHNLNIGEAVSGRAFVGFDFEQMFKDEDVYEGEWTLNNKTYPYIKNAPNKYCGDRLFYDDSNKPQTDAEKQALVDLGYLPVTDKEWARVAKCADGYFCDWIVCIAPGHTTTPDPNTENLPIDKGTTYTKRTYTEYRYKTTLGLDNFGRIMCEDLGTVSASDIDFNDIVFDAYIYDMIPVKRTKVTIILDNQEYTEQDWSNWEVDEDHANLAYTSTDVYLLAGGGTIPVTVADCPLKETFGTTDNVIVNTVDDRDNSDIKRYGNPYDNTQSYKQLSDIRNIETLNDIKVIVKYGSQVYELKAFQGVAPHKICVPLRTKWPYERIEINKAYDFNDYVRTETVTNTTVTYNGNNAVPIEVYDSEKGRNKIIGYYIDEYTNPVWKATPTDIQKGNRYHGNIDSDDDITAIPYASKVREIDTLLDRKENDGLPVDSYEDVVMTDNGGIQEGDEVLSRGKDLK
jgi:hypothetical protein